MLCLRVVIVADFGFLSLLFGDNWFVLGLLFYVADFRVKGKAGVCCFAICLFMVCF